MYGACDLFFFILFCPFHFCEFVSPSLSLPNSPSRAITMIINDVYQKDNTITIMMAITLMLHAPSSPSPTPSLLLSSLRQLESPPFADSTLSRAMVFSPHPPSPPKK